MRQDSLKTERPACQRGCAQTVHKHGFYERFKHPSGQEVWKIPRYYCPQCGHTISVIPVQALPYRPLNVARLQAHFDEKAKVGSGLDPPPSPTEAGCLKRAWCRFEKRTGRLQQVFGQLLPASLKGAGQLWLQMRRALASLQDILRWLAQTRNISLLGDYRCLRPSLSD